MSEVRDLFVSPETSLRDVMKTIDRGALGIALVVSEDERLLTTITDGDVRRALLDNTSLEAPVRILVETRSEERNRPVTVAAGVPPSEQRRILEQHSLRHLPIVDEAGRVIDLVTLSELVPRTLSSPRGVVMAGGFGKRLRPLTEHTPKPMLPVGDRPLMEHTLERLRDAGVRRISVTTHYLADRIKEHFGDGSEFGVELEYVSETEPLGTAGGLGLLEAEGPLLVINGDILTDVDFRAFHEFHEEQQADLTMGVRRYEIDVPYGIVETEGPELVALEEKPSLSFFVNAGIYLLDTGILDHVEPGEPLDMTDLIERLLAAGSRVVTFPIVEYWLDVGREDDYQRARNDLELGEMVGGQGPEDKSR